MFPQREVKLLDNGWHEIFYGENHHIQMAELLGVPDSRSMRPFQTFALFGTYRSDYELPDGRIARVHTSQYGFSSKVEILANREAYWVLTHNEDHTLQDPEGRGGRNTVGQKIQWVWLWMKQHPGERVPSDYNDCPELWTFDCHCERCLKGQELHLHNS